MAQDGLKIGHINTQELYESMPEYDSAQRKLEATAAEIEKTMEELQVEFNQKYENYVNNVNNYTELIRTTKESELQNLQERIQQFQATAQQDMQQQRARLFQPVQQKATNIISEVAEENGYTYIFDSGLGIVYTSPDSEDILPLVRKKMGLE